MKKHARSTSKGSSVLVSLLLLCVAVNFLVSWIAGSTLLNSDPSPSSSVIHPSKPKPKFKRQTMAPQESSHNTAGFIHVGKTGGSTISKLLRNGCTSFVEGPCRTIENESIVSKMVVRQFRCGIERSTVGLLKFSFRLFPCLRARNTTITCRTFIGYLRLIMLPL